MRTNTPTTQATENEEKGDPLVLETPVDCVPPLLLSQIKEVYRARVDFHRAEKKLTLQTKAILRRQFSTDKDKGKAQANALYDRMDKGEIPWLPGLVPLVSARDLVAASRKEEELMLKRLARQLPVWGWVKKTPGLGDLGLGQIVAEAGDLSNYSNPGKLWKRMGLAVMDGQAQRKMTDAEQAKAHGFNPQRRSVMYVIGSAIVKGKGPYREVYDERKLFQDQKGLDGGYAEKVARIVASGKVKEKENKERLAKGQLPKGMVHKQAQRYAEKRLLRELWVAWRS
jgi:hypothetical protein